MAIMSHLLYSKLLQTGGGESHAGVTVSQRSRVLLPAGYLLFSYMSQLGSLSCNHSSRKELLRKCQHCSVGSARACLEPPGVWWAGWCWGSNACRQPRVHRVLWVTQTAHRAATAECPTRTQLTKPFSGASRMSTRHFWSKMSPELRQSGPLAEESYSWHHAAFRLVGILDPNVETDWQEQRLEELLACIFGLKGESLHPDFLASTFLKRSFNNWF